jgi:hypothetical protein
MADIIDEAVFGTKSENIFCKGPVIHFTQNTNLYLVGFHDVPFSVLQQAYMLCCSAWSFD